MSATCPICSAPNGCRLETGEAYKGACWCERAPLPPATLQRLETETGGAHCLCQACLEALAKNPNLPLETLRQARRPNA